MKFRKGYLFGAATAVFVFVLTLLISCGGGGGGDGTSTGGGTGGGGGTTQQAKLDDAAVNDALNTIDTTMPGCKAVDVAQGTAKAMAAKTLLNDTSLVYRLYSRLASLRASGDGPVSMTNKAQTINGNCGGTISYDSVHASGITTYTIVMTDFCSEDTTVTPPEQTKTNGKLIAREVGTPSPSGPVISQWTVTTDGKLTVEAKGETTSLTLGQFTYDYGTPGVDPGVPTQSKPDRMRIDSLVINYESQGRTNSITNLDASFYEDGNNTVLDINSCRLTTDSHGYVDISTSQPIVMNEDGDPVSGSIDFTGASGDVLSVSPTGQDGVFEMSLNGQPLDKAIDCSGLGKELPKTAQ